MINKLLLNLIMLMAFWDPIAMGATSSSSSDLALSTELNISSATSSSSAIRVRDESKVGGSTQIDEQAVEEFHISNIEAARCRLGFRSAQEKKASCPFSALLALPNDLLPSILEIVTTKLASFKRVSKKFDRLIRGLVSEPGFASRLISGVIFEEYGNKKIWHGNDNSIVITLIKTPKILQDIPSFFGIDVIFGIGIIRFKRDLTRSEWKETLEIFEGCRAPDLSLDTYMSYLGTADYPVNFIYCTDGYAISKEKRDKALQSIFLNKDFSGDRQTSKVSFFDRHFLG